MYVVYTIHTCTCISSHTCTHKPRTHNSIFYKHTCVRPINAMTKGQLERRLPDITVYITYKRTHSLRCSGKTAVPEAPDIVVWDGLAVVCALGDCGIQERCHICTVHFDESAKYVFTTYKRKDFVVTDRILSGWQCKASPFIMYV